MRVTELPPTGQHAGVQSPPCFVIFVGIQLVGLMDEPATLAAGFVDKCRIVRC
jgi:hypothetical protein